MGPRHGARRRSRGHSPRTGGSAARRRRRGSSRRYSRGRSWDPARRTTPSGPPRALRAGTARRRSAGVHDRSAAAWTRSPARVRAGGSVPPRLLGGRLVAHDHRSGNDRPDRLSGDDGHPAMIIAVVAVRMMQMPVDQVVDVVAVRDRVVTTLLAADVPRLVAVAPM